MTYSCELVYLNHSSAQFTFDKTIFSQFDMNINLKINTIMITCSSYGQLDQCLSFVSLYFSLTLQLIKWPQHTNTNILLFHHAKIATLEVPPNKSNGDDTAQGKIQRWFVRLFFRLLVTQYIWTVCIHQIQHSIMCIVYIKFMSDGGEATRYQNKHTHVAFISFKRAKVTCSHLFVCWSESCVYVCVCDLSSVYK